MGHQIAYSLIESAVEELKLNTYDRLVSLIGQVQTREITGHEGKRYQLETELFWDGKKDGDIRVMVAADDGGWTAFKPLSGGSL